MKKTSALLLSALLLITLLSGCKKKEKDDKGSEAAQTTVFAVNTTAAVKGQIQDYIALSGDIIAGSTVDVYSDAAGKVAEVYVVVGQRVNRGDSIAAVDPSRPGMDFRWGVATAPISGTVVALPAQVGMTISQAVPLARISGGGALEIRLYVAERFISKMALNLPCEITLDAWPGDVFRGSISEIAPTVDPASRTMEVRVNVNNAGSKLKAGMFAKVRLITEHKDNIVKIPASALIRRFGENYVYVTEEAPSEEKTAEEQKAEKKGFFASLFGKFGKKKKADEENAAEAAPSAPPAKQYVAKKRVVQTGILIDGVLEIQNGLTPNEEVIVRGQTLLDDGSRVNIIDRVTPLGEKP